jgi:CRISPR/Cas system endoribonuclease Cas6 (RAMP superfamily)
MVIKALKRLADPKLIKIGYDCGFGNGGSMGLGCVGEYYG